MRHIGVILACTGLLASAWVTSVAAAPTGKTSPQAMVSKWDADHDGTLDANEIEQAATARFDSLDKDHDSSLDKGDLKGILTAKQFAGADIDHDGTIDKAEWLALVKSRFDKADRDNDGSLDSKELSSSAGNALLRLVR